jgi:hypothetical protein
VVLTPGRRRREPDDGAVAVLVTVVVVAVVLPVLSLVVDLGLTRTLAVQFRGAGEAAALAAAAQRPPSATDPRTVRAVTAARDLVAVNLPAPDAGWAAAWASCVDPAPLPAGTAASAGNCISFDYTLKQVRVTVPGRAVPSVFTGLVGSSPPQASATVTASWGDKISPAVGSCALCLSGSYSSGAERVRVSGGDTAVGGSLTMTWPGSLQVTGGGVTYATSWTSAGGRVSPLPVQRPAPADPFAAQLAALRAAVPYGQPSSPGPGTGSPGACSPGVYQTVSGCASFGPGTYYVTGKPATTQQVALNADANGVLLFVTCSTSGGATGVLAAPCPSGVLPRFTGASGAPHSLSAPGGSGLALVFDEGFSRNEILDGAQQLTVTGDVYGPGVTLRPGGWARALVRGRVAVRGVSGNTSYPTATMLQVDAPPATGAGVIDGAVRLVRSG